VFVVSEVSDRYVF